MKGIAVDLASELDEPVKPEVTQFVADWYEQHKDILDYSIWEACVNSRADYDDLEGTTGVDVGVPIRQRCWKRRRKKQIKKHRTSAQRHKCYFDNNIIP